jgi:dihydrodipicolinate synthase/N-acetylneuraminate lyase
MILPRKPGAAASRRDATRVAELQERVLSLGRIYQIGQHASAVVKGIKCALSLLGICSDVLAEPFSPFRAPERERVRTVLDSLGLLKAGPAK